MVDDELVCRWNTPMTLILRKLAAGFCAPASGSHLRQQKV